MSLIYIGQQITIYGGYFFLLAGLVGNGVNVFVFSSVRTYRTTSCTFYFLVCSIDNIIYIMINLIYRIVTIGYGIDLTHTSIIWCKVRHFFTSTPPLISFTCSCLAVIDQFLVTSQSVYLRSCSNMKLAYRILFIMIIISCFHGSLCFFSTIFHLLTIYV
jgi:hypothetical protein